MITNDNEKIINMIQPQKDTQNENTTVKNVIQFSGFMSFRERLSSYKPKIVTKG